MTRGTATAASDEPNEGASNLVDDTLFTRPLIKALTRHVDAFQRSIAGPGADHYALEAARPGAVAWVFYTVLAAWAGDHGLIRPWLRKDFADGYAEQAANGVPPSDWLTAAFCELGTHPATECLIDSRYSELQTVKPAEDACAALVDYWMHEAPLLRYEADRGPTSIMGWLPGDLLQALSAERRKRYAFCQTPWWICDFILDRTLVPAVDEFRDVSVIRLVDPACGTGHFLIRAVDYLWEWYTTGTLTARTGPDPRRITGGPVLGPREAARRIVAGVHGVDRDPLTTAVARLRFTVGIGERLHTAGALPSFTLATIPAFEPAVTVGDSLLAGLISEAEYADLHPHLAAIVNLGYRDGSEPVPSRRPQ